MAMILLHGADALAQDGLADFYRGKTVTIVVGFEPGGGYDAYMRLIARHMGDHVAGQPKFIVQNMPGAGTRVAANWLYAVAPRDGTTLGSLVQSTPIDQVLGEPGVRFDAGQFNWIGNPIIDNLVTLSSTLSGFKTLEDVKVRQGLICGSSGGGPTVTFPHALSHLLSIPIDVVGGYPGVTAINLAIERNEVNCLGGTAWSSMKATMAPMMQAGKVVVLAQWGREKDPEISAFAKRDVPLITDYARTLIDRDALNFLVSSAALSRPLMAPPGVPAEQVAQLRAAFDATMKDPAFLADALKSGIDIKPKPGGEIQTLVREIVSTPAETVKRAKELIE